MTFIITLVSLVIERFFDWSHIRKWGWLTRFQNWLSGKFKRLPAALILILSLLLPVLIVAIINALLTGALFGVLKLIFGIIIVMYCLGPNNLWAQVYVCIEEIHKEDASTAMHKLQNYFNLPLTRTAQTFHHALTDAMFIEANRRIFSVLFWFILLGPAGAVIYRLIDLSRSSLSLQLLSEKLHALLDWIPIRLYTFLFALGGHFTEVIKHWKKGALAAPAANDNLITECGVAALDVLEAKKIPEDGSAEQETLSLLDRVFVIGLVILAIIVLL